MDLLLCLIPVKALLCRMAYFTDETFEDVATLAVGNYENCEFINGQLAGIDLSGSNFIDCHFQGCDLSNATLTGVGLKTVSFGDCKLLGLHFDDCSDFLFAISCNGCNLELATFRNWKLKGTDFYKCQLRETDFTEADLEGATFIDCDLYRTIFYHTNLQKSDFSTASNYRLSPQDNRLKGAQFSRAGLEGLLAEHGLKIID